MLSTTESFKSTQWKNERKSFMEMKAEKVASSLHAPEDGSCKEYVSKKFREAKASQKTFKQSPNGVMTEVRTTKEKQKCMNHKQATVGVEMEKHIFQKNSIFPASDYGHKHFGSYTNSSSIISNLDLDGEESRHIPVRRLRVGVGEHGNNRIPLYENAVFLKFFIWFWIALRNRKSTECKPRRQKHQSNCSNDIYRESRPPCIPLSLSPTVLHLFVFLLLFPPTKFVAAGCRDDDSRACEAICDGNVNDINSNCRIRALVLLPDNDKYIASLRRVLPILKVAVDKLHDAQVLPRHISFEWMPHDDRCDAAYAVIQAMDGIVKNCAHVIFGPVCDYPLASVSRITKYMNSQGTPLISVGGSTYDFEMKKTSCSDEFYMLLRTGIVSFETISEMTIAVMKRNKWSHSIFFYERDGQESVAGLHTCFLMMNSLGKQMRKENMTFAQYQLSSQPANRTEEMRREIGNKHATAQAKVVLRTLIKIIDFHHVN